VSVWQRVYSLGGIGGGDVASKFGPSFRREFRAWVVLSELRQFWWAADSDILSAATPAPLPAVCPSFPPPWAACSTRQRRRILFYPAGRDLRACNRIPARLTLWRWSSARECQRGTKVESR
jgi:hypothetical protein